MYGSMLLSISSYIKGIFSFIPKVMYLIVSCLLSLIDLCQISFRKLAGLDAIKIGSESYQGDTVYKIITDALFIGKYPAIQTVFWSLILLGVFMLFVTSIIALIRLEYMPDEKTGNSKSGVVKNFFKAIFSFAIVPIACIFGMYLSNALVGIVDKATSTAAYSNVNITQYFKPHTTIVDGSSDNEDVSSGQTTSTNYYMAYQIFGTSIPTSTEPFSGTIFKACAYGCNRIRNSEKFYLIMKEHNVLGIFDLIHNQPDAADIIDVGFAINAKLKTKASLSKSIVDDYFTDVSFFNFHGWSYSNINQLSKYNADAVFYFYNLWSFNYIIAFVSLISIAKMYFNFLLYLMQRLFEVVGLFVIAPISISLMPLDNGKALGTWRTSFISKFATLVVMVFSLNLISPLINICQEIKFFDGKYLQYLNYILLTFFLMAAFNAVNAINKMFVEIFGGDKNYSEAGEKMAGDLRTGLSKAVSTAKIAAAPALIPAKAGVKAAGKGVGKGVKSIGAKIDSKRDAKLERKQEDQQEKVDDAKQKQQTANQANKDSEAYKKAYASATKNNSNATAADVVNTALKTDKTYQAATQAANDRKSELEKQYGKDTDGLKKALETDKTYQAAQSAAEARKSEFTKNAANGADLTKTASSQKSITDSVAKQNKKNLKEADNAYAAENRRRQKIEEKRQQSNGLTRIVQGVGNVVAKGAESLGKDVKNVADGQVLNTLNTILKENTK